MSQPEHIGSILPRVLPRPIETAYAGCRFRSRLEARYAVFFDALRIEWSYEPEGFDLGELGWYLPDFWLPQVQMYAEVKPAWPTPAELARTDALPSRCLLLDGPPADHCYFARGELDDGPAWVDYHPAEMNAYHLSESRFYACCGAADSDRSPPHRPADNSFGDDPTNHDAVRLARSARFDGHDLWGRGRLDPCALAREIP